MSPVRCGWRRQRAARRARFWRFSVFCPRSSPPPSGPPRPGSTAGRQVACAHNWRRRRNQQWRSPPCAASHRIPTFASHLGGRFANVNFAPLAFAVHFHYRGTGHSMPSFHNGDVEIAFLDEGEGDPIVLVHGFASSKNVNWVYPAWVSELRKNGRRVIALDNRGHGDSAKLYEPGQYSIPMMAGDVVALMDHLDIARADIMGYSLGGRMTAWLGLNRPERLRSAILGGIGAAMIEGGGPARTSCAHSKRRRSRMSAIPWVERSVRSPTRPDPTARRWPPACAARA